MKLFHSKRDRCMITLLLLLAMMMTFFTPSYSYAEDSVTDLESTTSDLEHELSGLSKEASVLNAELDSILTQLNEVATEIEQTKADLAAAKGDAAAQYESMKIRIRYMYENGSINYLEILFSSTSIADFLSRAEYIVYINQHDRRVYEQLDSTRAEIAQKEADLQEKQNTLFSLKEELSAREAQLNQQISIASGELAQYKDKLEKARAAAAKAEAAAKEEVVPITPEPEEPPAPEPEQSDQPDTNTPVINPATGDVELLAALIECEAGSTDYEGMLAVGSVVMNRIKNRHYPDTLRGVIYQSGQFTPVSSGKLDRVLERGVNDTCVVAARDALDGKNNVGDCLSFRAVGSGHTGIIIGDNVFF